ncbi:MAG TPA: hypothetical protein VKE69_10525 [Planctomycetota bacterium]|nr:hypothetical protein [Planctomycetota bacterium]
METATQDSGTQTIEAAGPPAALPGDERSPRARFSLSFDPVVRGLPSVTLAELLATAIGRVASRFASAKETPEPQRS